jgi:membrane-bound ClpP family serine protease
MDKTIIKYKNIVSVISTIMLLLAMADLPYGYYNSLRLVITASAIFLVWIAYKLKREFWLFSMGIVALLFNPIVPIYLDKEIWVIIDFIVATLFLVSIFKIKPKE